MRIVWRGREIQLKTANTLANRMKVIGVSMVRDIKRDLGTPGPMKTAPMQSASAPGEPPHRRSGRLRRSIAHELHRLPFPILRVGTNVKYASALELGTGPYIIRPVKAKMLAWKTPDGQWHFAKQVHHPGMAPRPFLRPALMRVKKDIGRIVRGG